MANTKCNTKSITTAVKNWLTLERILGIVCLLLMVALAVTMFLPNWTISKGTQMSIFDETWLNYEKAFTSFIKDMKAQIKDANLMDTSLDSYKKMSINDFVYPAAILTLISLFGFVFCPFKLGKPLGLGFSLACGGVGIWMCLCHPIYQLGAVWGLTLGISAALTAVALANIVICIVKALKK